MGATSQVALDGIKLIKLYQALAQPVANTTLAARSEAGPAVETSRGSLPDSRENYPGCLSPLLANGTSSLI